MDEVINQIIQVVLKELETNPDQFFQIIQGLINIFKNNPVALSTAIKLATVKKP